MLNLISMDLRNYIFGTTKRQIIYKSLDASAMRGRAIAQNLANVSTPGYRRKEVSFEDRLREVMDIKVKGKTTNEKHIEISQDQSLKKLNPKVYEPQDPTLPGEINNVDIDLEASKMAENQILYQYALKFAGFNKLNNVISGNSGN